MYQAEQEIKKINQALGPISKAISLRQMDNADLLSLWYPLAVEEMRLQRILFMKKNEINHLDQAIVKLHNEMFTTREKGAELNCHIRRLNSRMQHGKNTLVEEKRLLGEIKQLDGMRHAVFASETKKKDIDQRRDNIYKYFESGWDQNFRNQVEFTEVEDLDVVKKQKRLISQRIKPLKELVRQIDNEISLLQVKWTANEQKKRAAYEHLFELAKQLENEVENFSDGYVTINLPSLDDETFSALNLHKEDNKSFVALGCVDFQEEKEKLYEFEEPDKALYRRNMIDRAKSKEKKKKLADKAVVKVNTWTQKDAERILSS